MIPGNIGTLATCTACAACGDVCPTDAIEVKGNEWEAEDLCRDKYIRLGQHWPFADSPLMREEEMNSLLAAAHTVLDHSPKVSWTGLCFVNPSE